MHMAFEATKVTFVEGYRLEVEFEDGEKGTVDLTAQASKGGVFGRFTEPGYFRGVTINRELGVLTWPNGEDIAPEAVYHMATGKSLPAWVKAAVKA